VIIEEETFGGAFTAVYLQVCQKAAFRLPGLVELYGKGAEWLEKRAVS